MRVLVRKSSNGPMSGEFMGGFTENWYHRVRQLRLQRRRRGNPTLDEVNGNGVQET